MNRRLLTCLLFLSLLSLPVGATKRALLIGIGPYPQDQDDYWNTIHGDRDVALLKGVLLQHGFRAEHIRTLVNAQATYAGIQWGFRQLINACQTGDTVYVHFSGHGQRITDLSGDEPTGFDEAWVPYDALQVPSSHYHGEKHLVDDEINRYLHAIRQRVGKKGHISVVADACHSAGCTRNETETDDVVRGTSAIFELRGIRHPYTRPNEMDWLLLSACSSEGFNRQCRVDGQWYGSLSYALYLLRDQLSSMPANRLRDLLEETLHGLLGRTQEPVLEGPPEQINQPLL